MILEYRKNYPIKCPKCNAVGNYKKHSSYKRNLIFIHTIITIVVHRIKCCSCNTTHALIPKDAIPYRQFSIEFVAYLCNDKLQGKSNSNLRNKYKICESTRWRLINYGLKDIALSLKTNKTISSINKKLINRNITNIAYKFLFKFQRKYCQNIRLNKSLNKKIFHKFKFP